MALLPLKIAVLHYQAKGDPIDPVVEHITDALRELGHEPVKIAVDDRVFDILRAIERSKCDLVFNVCETFADDYRMEVNVAALMEMARVKYTGSGVAGLLLAQDKVLAKQLLGYHEVRTPNYATFDGEAFETHGKLDFPLIVKPARTDASIGIGGKSVVKDWDELTARVRAIRKELNDESLAEEFIDGREVYVGVLGGTGATPEILPIVELDWGNWDPAKPRVSDREVKFGPDTEGSPKLVIAKNISDEMRMRIERAALFAFRVLKLRDYARVDFRISDKTGDVYVLEANPNPYLEKQSELAMAAKERGISYAQTIGRIVESAAARYKIPRKPPAEPKPVVVPAAVSSSPADPAGATASAPASNGPHGADKAGDKPLEKTSEPRATRAEKISEKASMEKASAEKASAEKADRAPEPAPSDASPPPVETPRRTRSGEHAKPKLEEVRADPSPDAALPRKAHGGRSRG